MAVIHLGCAFFGLEFWQQLVTTLLGIAIGIPVALWIDRFIETKRSEGDRIDLTSLLRATIERNQSLVEQLRRDIGERHDYTPSYPVDTTILDATAARKYEVLRDPAIARSVDNARYELQHLNLQLELFRLTAVRMDRTSEAQSGRGVIRSSIIVHLPIVKDALEEALKHLK